MLEHELVEGDANIEFPAENIKVVQTDICLLDDLPTGPQDSPLGKAASIKVFLRVCNTNYSGSEGLGDVNVDWERRGNSRLCHFDDAGEKRFCTRPVELTWRCRREPA